MLWSYELCMRCHVIVTTMYLSCICHLIHGHVESQSIWCFYLSKEALFSTEAIISAQQLVSLQLGDGMCLGGALFAPITSTLHCWHYDSLGGVHDMPHTML